MIQIFHTIATQFPLKVIKSGDSGGPATAKQSLIINPEELNQFFDGSPPEGVEPEGFTFAVALGNCPTSGYGVEITGISQDTGGVLAGAVHVHYSETTPQGPTTDQITTPYTLVQAEGMQYASHIFFTKDTPAPVSAPASLDLSFETPFPEFIAGLKFKVVALTGTHTGCQILPEDALYLAIYTQVYGPASRLDCETFVADHCGPVHPVGNPEL